MDYQAPATFEEYLELYPTYHKMWLAQHHSRLLGKPEFDDACQHIMLRTLSTRRVEKYNPANRIKHSKSKKDTPGLFLNWMAQCFANDMVTLWKRGQSHIRKVNENTSSLDDLIHNKHPESTGVTENEALPLYSQYYRRSAKREGEKIMIEAQIAEFRRFVAIHRPELLPIIDNFGAATTEDKRKLFDLMRHMTNGTKPYVKRKPYSQRVNKYSADQVAELAARGLKASEAAAILGCHPMTIGELSRRHFGMNWRALVRMKQTEAAAV